MDARRALDLVVSVPALAVAAPLLIGSAAAMRLLGDRGPFLYRAIRVGEGGRAITVLKIRTMADGARGAAITSAGDTRVTPLGHVLRRYRLDELPQLVNVVRGDMSLVGPRPEDPAFVDFADPLHRRVFTVRPGITGPTQIAFRAEDRLLTGPDIERRYREVILPAKVQVDAAYLDCRTVRGDVRILWQTVVAVLRPTGRWPRVKAGS